MKKHIIFKPPVLTHFKNAPDKKRTAFYFYNTKNKNLLL